MKLVVDIAKATTHVRPYMRDGKPVAGHLREVPPMSPVAAEAGDIGWRCGARPPAGDLKAVEKHFMDRVPGLTLELSGKSEPDAYGRMLVNLELIQVDEKKQGTGTKVMDDLVRWADHNAKTLTLSVADRNDQLGTTSGARLHRFYKRFGFVDNKGRRKDYALSMYVNMYRKPQVMADKSTVQVAPHIRDGHAVRGHVRVLKRRVDTHEMGRNLHRWTKPRDEWDAEDIRRWEVTNRQIAESKAKTGMAGQSEFKPIEDLSGVVVSKAELPPVLYHVTAHADAIEADGVIRVTDSMEKGGLGGSHLATHFCRDRAQAEMIRRELLRAGQIARGEVTDVIFDEWARADEQLGGLPAGALDAAVAETHRTYQAYASDPSHHLRFSEWDGFMVPPSEAEIATAKPHPSVADVLVFPDGSMGGWRAPGEWGWQMGPVAKPWSILNDAYDLYLNARSSASFRVNGHASSVLDNPLLLGNSKAFEIATPESIAIIEVPTANIPDEALIVRPNVNFNGDGVERNDFLTEVRIYSDVPTDGARFAEKSIEQVKPHIRDGKLVQGYVRDSRDRRIVNGEMFAESQVRDAEGRLLVMYHGTDTGFSEFRTEAADSGALYGAGLYFTDNAKIAEGYAGDAVEAHAKAAKLRVKIRARKAEWEAKWEEHFLKPYRARNYTEEKIAENREAVYRETGWKSRIDSLETDLADLEDDAPNIHAVYLDIRKPFDVENATDEEMRKLIGAWHEGVTPAMIADQVYKCGQDLDHKRYLIRKIIDRNPSALRDLGYDGITHVGGLITGRKEHKVFIAFDVSQVHSIIGRTEKGVVTKPLLPFAKPQPAERKKVQKPGSRGATEWYIDKDGAVMYGPRPTPEAEARWDDRPDPTSFAERHQREAATIASPEDREGLKFDEVYERHANFEHHAFLREATKIDEEAGIEGQSELALGDTEEWGTEPSLVTTYADIPDTETLRYVAAKRGLYSKTPQKAVIAWERDEGGGQDHLYSVTVQASAPDLPKALDKAGLPYRTLVEHENGTTTVHVFQVASMAKQDDIEASLVIFADAHGGPDVERQAGRAEFIGADDREAAGKIYQGIIDEYEAKRGSRRAARPAEGDGGLRATGSDGAVRKGITLTVRGLSHGATYQADRYSRAGCARAAHEGVRGVDRHGGRPVGRAAHLEGEDRESTPAAKSAALRRDEHRGGPSRSDDRHASHAGGGSGGGLQGRSPQPQHARQPAAQLGAGDGARQPAQSAGNAALALQGDQPPWPAVARTDPSRREADAPRMVPQSDGSRATLRSSGARGRLAALGAQLPRLIVAFKSFWERKPVQNPGSRGSTKWYRSDSSGEVEYGDRPSPRQPAAPEAPSAPQAPSLAAPKVTTAVRPALTVGRGSSGEHRLDKPEVGRSTRPPVSTPQPSPGAREPHSSPPPKGRDAKKSPPGTASEKRQAAMSEVELPSFKLTDEPSEDDAKLAVVALLKAGVLKQNTRGKAKGRLTLDVGAANDLRYTPTEDPSERGLRAALEGLRTYGSDPYKPNSAEINAEFGKAYHEGGDTKKPLRAKLRGDMKIGAMMASLIERTNAGDRSLLGMAEEKTKVTREGLAAQAARLTELRAKIPKLLAAKRQTTNAEGDREDRSTWQPPKFITVGGNPKFKPRAWQSGCCEWAQEAGRGIVGLDMGMGKTGFAIMDFAGRKERGESDQALVFSEVNQLGGWREEFEAWWPGVKVTVLTGDDREEQLAQIAKEKPDVIVASYGLLSTEKTEALDKLTGGKKTSWYFDEARALRNTATTSYKTAKTYLDKREEAVSVFPLTGTPTPNNPSEAHALLDLLHPGLLGPAAAFKRQHEQTVKVGGKSVKSFTNLQRLAKDIEPWSYAKSRFDADARHVLPNLVRVPMKLTMGQAQKVEYDKATAGILNVLTQVEDPQAMTTQEKGQALATLTKMRQAAYDPATYDPGYTGGSAVVDATIARLDEALRLEPDRGVVAFAEHVSNFEAVKQRAMKELGLEDHEVGIITGEVSATERTKLRKDLNDGKLKVLFAGYGSGGQGMNLQGRSRRVITMQDPWTWARKDQAVARVHRQGQKEITEHVSMTVPGTITDKMEATLSKKKGLGEALWGAKESDEVVHTALDFEDYLALAGIDLTKLNAARKAAGRKEIRA